MSLWMRIIVLMISALASLSVYAQNKTEVYELIPPDPASSQYDNTIGGGKTLTSSLNFYKKYISSQDASHCSFSPSCSEYAAEAVKKQGLIKGLVNFADRFQRCNGKSPEQYVYIKDKHLLFDPVRNVKHQILK